MQPKSDENNKLSEHKREKERNKEQSDQKWQKNDKKYSKLWHRFCKRDSNDFRHF